VTFTSCVTDVSRMATYTYNI